MKTIAYLLIFTCIALPLKAQHFSITKLLGADTGIQFPYFTKGADSLITKRINTTLFLSELEILPDLANKSIDKVIGIKESLGFGVNAKSYNIYQNDDKLLSLVFHSSASGLTTYYWSSNYTFNAQNGSLIKLKDVIDQSKYKQFVSLVNRKGQQHVQQQIPEFTTSIDTSEYKLMTDEVKSCFREVEYESFYVSADTLFIDQINCLSKPYFVMGWDMVVPLSIHEIAPLLSAYGKAIFINRQNNISTFKSNQLHQLMKGSIGKYPIEFIIEVYSNQNVSGIYTYTSKGLGIKLEGTLENDTINLVEYDSNQNEAATIKATLKHGTIEGIWQNKKTKKQLPIRLSIE